MRRSLEVLGNLASFLVMSVVVGAFALASVWAASFLMGACVRVVTSGWEAAQ